MRLIWMQVAPVHGQVALVVPDSEEEPPTWPTGHELVVANAGTISVATIADVDGHVTIEVWLGEEPPHLQGGPIYDGMLQVRDASALVGDLTGNHLGRLWHLREGAHRVRVYTDAPSQHPEWAEHVDFVID